MELRCEGCGLALVLEDLDVAPGELVADCPDCGCSVYVVDVVDLVGVIEGCAECVASGAECVFHAGFAAGWDACAAMMARSVDAVRLAELIDVTSGERS